MRECKSGFSSTPPSSNEGSREMANDDMEEMVANRRSQAAFSNMMVSSFKKSDKGGVGRLQEQAIGVIPVRVDMPTVGKLFRFEQNLVSEVPVPLSVDYKLVGEKWCSRRSVNSCSLL